MIILKYISLFFILAISTSIGFKISKKYSTRLRQLSEIQRALNIFEEKIKFTYEPIPDVFKELSIKFSDEINNIFYMASQNMKIMTAGEAWEKALDNSETKLTKEDIETLKGLAKMLGKTDLDGQVSEIRLTRKFLETKMKEAEIEKNKNSKMFKTLGATLGLTVVIILV